MKTPAENSTKRLDKSQKEEIQSPFSQGRVRQFAFFLASIQTGKRMWSGSSPEPRVRCVFTLPSSRLSCLEPQLATKKKHVTKDHFNHWPGITRGGAKRPVAEIMEVLRFAILVGTVELWISLNNLERLYRRQVQHFFLVFSSSWSAHLLCHLFPFSMVCLFIKCLHFCHHPIEKKLYTWITLSILEYE